MSKKITIPELSLVMLVGPSGSGKSTFAEQYFKPTEVISSDFCRALVSDDPSNQACTSDAFEVLHYIVTKRLQAGKLTVIDATNVQPEARKSLIQLARKYHVLPVAIVLNVPCEVCIERNLGRSDRSIGKHAIRKQHRSLQRSLRSLKKKEGITQVYVLNAVQEVHEVAIDREPTWTNKKNEKGPFDIIGDIHGCFYELKQLLEKLGYKIEKQNGYTITHAENRRIIFLGDLVDRGPSAPEVLRLVMDSVASGRAFCVNGNHDDKLKRKLMGRNVAITHGLQETLDQLENESEAFKESVLVFLQGLISHYVLDEGKLAVSHAGLKEAYIGRGSPQIRTFCMYGEITGEVDELGLPVRYLWANSYRGETKIIYGHTPVSDPEWINNTINIDTGCVFGGKLTAFRYPENQLVSVRAAHVYCDPVRPLDHRKQPNEERNILEIEDVMGKRSITTKLHRRVTIGEDKAIAALETMSRFSVDPRWLIYLPPTMSPTEACREGELLEHPEEAFSFYGKRGIEQLICEEKHMGSRVIIVICKDSAAVKKHFGISGNEIGCAYTRTGRNFFIQPDIEQEFLIRTQRAITESGLWKDLKTDWVCLDAELMPWSAKAQPLLKQQYASVGAAAEAALPEVRSQLMRANKRNVEGVQSLYSQFNCRLEMIKAYRNAYRKYCWKVKSVNDYTLAPFHILAHENGFNMDKDHLWHLNIMHRVCETAPDLFRKTAYRVVDLLNKDSCRDAISWWMDMTNRGGEGMVVKPLEFTVKNEKGLLQPGIKCRGREYLRIIYGPEYTAPGNMERLRARNLRTKLLWHSVNMLWVMKHYIFLSVVHLCIRYMRLFLAYWH